jgi:lauroyl/myristoyl acyltransferase
LTGTARGKGPAMPVRLWLAGWEIVKWLPEPVAHGFGRIGGAVAYRRDTRRRGNLRANLRQVVGPEVSDADLERLVRRGFASYAQYWIEAFRLERLTARQVRKRFHFEGVEALERCWAEGRGVVAAVPHMGNWDVGGAFLAARGIPAATVAERLKPVELFNRFVRYREALGLEIVPSDDGPKAIRRLVECLREGKTVALVADRDLGGRGIPVTLFGRRAFMPGGPASLALRTGSALIPAAVYQVRPGRWRALTRGAIEITPTGDMRADTAELTRKLAAEFEYLIGLAPEQWHMLVPYWPVDPAPGVPAPGGSVTEEART